MPRDITDEEFERVLASAARKVSRHLDELRDEAADLRRQAKDVDERAREMRRTWNKEQPWDLANVLTKREIEVLAEYGDWGKESPHDI